jgi:hypothetical protein
MYKGRDWRHGEIDQRVARTTTLLPDQASACRPPHIDVALQRAVNLRDHRLFQPIKTVDIDYSGVNCQIQLLARRRRNS